MQDLKDDYYAILGTEETASIEEIRKAYLKLARKLHPDRFPNDPEKRQEAQGAFGRITRAHEVLSDKNQRDEYDALRRLAKKKHAIDSGLPTPSKTDHVQGNPGASLSGASMPVSPGSQTQTPGSPASTTKSSSGIPGTGMVGQTTEQRIDKESWAAKHYQRSQDFYCKQRYQEAETAIKEAIRLAPNSPTYHCQLAEIYHTRGWKTLAMTELQTALRIDPKNSDAKQLEIRFLVASRAAARKKKESTGGWLNQLKQLFSKKI